MIKMNHATTKDVKESIPILKEFYPLHNTFQQPPKKIEAYLKTLKGTWVVAKNQNEEVVGTCYIESKGKKKWRIKHLAVKKSYLKHGVEETILAYAEQAVIVSGLIEIHVAENETLDLEFYESSGYSVSDTVPGYYRPGEICFFMEKTVTGLDE